MSFCFSSGQGKETTRTMKAWLSGSEKVKSTSGRSWKLNESIALIRTVFKELVKTYIQVLLHFFTLNYRPHDQEVDYSCNRWWVVAVQPHLRNAGMLEIVDGLSISRYLQSPPGNMSRIVSTSRRFLRPKICSNRVMAIQFRLQIHLPVWTSSIGWGFVD